MRRKIEIISQAEAQAKIELQILKQRAFNEKNKSNVENNNQNMGRNDANGSGSGFSSSAAQSDSRSPSRSRSLSPNLQDYALDGEDCKEKESGAVRSVVDFSGAL